jgi:hypothetical protein
MSPSADRRRQGTVVWLWFTFAFQRPKRAFNRPVAAQSMLQNTRWYSEPDCPFGHRQRFPVERHATITALIAGLLCSRRPAHVTGLIASVIVDTINRERCRWAVAYVSKKGLEIVAPFVADMDAARAVIPKKLVGWSVTPAFHMLPDSIFGRMAQAVRHAVLSGSVSLATTATGRMAGHQIAGKDFSFNAARASAVPMSFTSGARHHRQAAELSAGQVDKSRHTERTIPSMEPVWQQAY